MVLNIKAADNQNGWGSSLSQLVPVEELERLFAKHFDTRVVTGDDDVVFMKVSVED